MVTIKEITAEESNAAADRWAITMPRWWRELDTTAGAFKSHGPVVEFGVFEDEVMTANITVQELAPRLLDAHLSCQRRPNVSILTGAIEVLKTKVKQAGYRTVYLWPYSKSRGLVNLTKAWGFRETGVKLLQGSVGGHTAEWIQVRLEL